MLLSTNRVIIITHVLINRSNVTAMLAYMSYYTEVRAHLRQHETSPPTLYKSEIKPAKLTSTRGNTVAVAIAVAVKRAIDANERIDEQHQNSQHRIRRANEPRVGARQSPWPSNQPQYSTSQH